MKRITMLLGAGILFLCSMVYAAVPQLINFQGILRDGSGNPVANGSYSVVFTIYDAASGGTNLWQETQSVNTVNGLFTVLLGIGPTPLDYSLFNDSTRWLGVKVGADPEMTPRQRLSSIGYSYNSSEWTSAAQDLFRLNGNVGIGTAPLGDVTKLDVLIFGSDPISVKGMRSQVENSSSGNAIGGHFVTSSGGTGPHYGVYAQGNGNSSAETYGTYGAASSNSFLRAAGAYGEGTNNGSGLAYGGYFTASSSGTGGHIGVYGAAYHTANYATGLSGYASNTSVAYGVQGGGYSSSDLAYGGSFTGSGAYGSAGVYATGTTYGVRAVNSGGTGTYGLKAESDYDAIYASTSGSSSNPIYGTFSDAYNSSTGTAYAGYFSGSSASGPSYGVYGSAANFGVYGSASFYGVYGTASANGGTGVYGSNGGNPSTYAGYFVGTLYVNGTAGNNTGVWSNLSDRRLKKDIEPLQNALETVEQLQPVSFRWKDAKKDAEFGRVRGLIAQDVEKVIPEWIKTDLDGYKRIEPIGVDALLIEAIKELKAENDDLRERILKLERGKPQAHVE